MAEMQFALHCYCVDAVCSLTPAHAGCNSPWMCSCRGALEALADRHCISVSQMNRKKEDHLRDGPSVIIRWQ